MVSLRILAGLVLLALGCRVGPHVPPAPTAYVTDRADVLRSDTRAALGVRLGEYEDATGRQVYVWIDRDLPRVWTSIYHFALTAFNAWGIGRRGHDDGVVLFVFPEGRSRRQIRIQVGRGLEMQLSDAECVRIANEVIGARMKAGQPDLAIASGVGAILEALGDE